MIYLIIDTTTNIVVGVQFIEFSHVKKTKDAGFELKPVCHIGRCLNGYNSVLG